MKSKISVKRHPSAGIDEIEKLAQSLRGPDTVKVGLPKGSNAYPDGTSVIMVGAVHEFGSPSRGVPQRSFLRTTVIEHRRAYAAFMKKLTKKMVSGDMTKEKALGLLGLKVQTDVRSKITDISTPPLKDRDGNPLVDTGHLRQSIIFKVGE